MFRSLFLALGAYTCLLGVEAIAVEKAVLKEPAEGQKAFIEQREIVPPVWAPSVLLGGGAVVVLYSFTIPKRMNG